MKDSQFCVWLTGLPASGKTTLAEMLSYRLKEMEEEPVVLDGDDVRRRFFPELGFTREARIENGRRVVELCRLVLEAGGVPIVALVSPYRVMRDWARAQLPNLVEVWVWCPTALCESRDPKGLWKKARAGDLLGFTGVDDPYEQPMLPDVTVRTDVYPPNIGANIVLGKLERLGYLHSRHFQQRGHELAH